MRKLTRKIILIMLLFFIAMASQATYVIGKPGDIFEEKLSLCKNYEDYENLAIEIKKTIEKNPNAKNVDKLYYVFAQARIEELALLAKDNDIESVRHYMRVNESYFNEAVTMLDKASEATSSKSLKLDILFSKLIILKEKFKTQKADAIFYDLASKVADFSSNPKESKNELDRISNRFVKKGLEEDALRLKVLYAKKVGPKGASAIASELKASADQAFEENDLKKANTLYQNYLTLSRDVLKEDVLAKNMLNIADRYFNKKQYAEALKYYDDYVNDYRDMDMIDYCSYKIAECLYAIRRYDAAAAQFESFLNGYHDSKWFNQGFVSLSRLYYENSNMKQGTKKLQVLIKRYPEKKICDYAEFLTGLLYYGGRDYDQALAYFKNVKNDYPGTSYSYAADKLIKDIRNIKENNALPSYTHGSDDTYRAWNAGSSPSIKVTPDVLDGKNTALLKNKEFLKKVANITKEALSFTKEAYAEEAENSQSIQITVKPGAKVKFTLDQIIDLDKFGEYLYDKSDRSRLPKKVTEGEEEDLLSLKWTTTGGKFESEKQSSEKIWIAPNKPGQYIISVEVKDLGVTRPPDEGSRKDEPIGPVTIIVTVTR